MKKLQTWFIRLFKKSKEHSKISRYGHKQDELKIVESINTFGKKIYSIEKYKIWGKYCSMWFTEIDNIDTWEEAVDLKSEMEQEILEKTIISRSEYQ